MEKDILEQLYFGEIVPCEKQGDRTPELVDAAGRIDGWIGQLKERLDEEGKGLLGKLLDESSELERRVACEGFKDGFRLGAQITAAALGSEKKP